MEYPIRSHVASNGCEFRWNLLGLALSDRLVFSKLAMSIRSMTAHNGSCELFKVDIS